VDGITKSYLIQKFSEYYAGNNLILPKEFRKREWAFVSIESIPDFIMIRHIAFQSEAEVKGYLMKRTPLHAFHSSAYYEKPDADKMEEKGWIGADLIFDIDSDHLKKGGLGEAKKQITRLYDLLESEFGVSEMTLVFSGSRGYHIHIHDKDYTTLESPERREIVDYITLNGLAFHEVFPKTPQYIRIARCMDRILSRIFRENLAKEFFKLRQRSADRIQAIYTANRERILKGDYSMFPSKIRDKLERLFQECVERARIYVDPPVTADVKRLIRLPGSLHGKTSFRVMKISRDEIEDFKPTEDAIAFGEENVRVRLKSRVRVRLKGEEFRLSRGKHLLPEYLALYLICRNMALYGW